MSSGGSETIKASVHDTKSNVNVDVKSGIVELNHYWPYGIKDTDKEKNLNLLYLFSKRWPIESKCNCADLKKSIFTEIKRVVIYERHELIQSFPAEMDSDKCLKEFRETLNSKESINIRRNFICGKCNGQYSSTPLPEYLEYTPINIYRQDRKLCVYLDLEAAKRIPMPSDVVNHLSSCFGKLLRKGKFMTSEIDFEKEKDPKSRTTRKAANAQTIDWMKELETKKKTERNTIMKRSFSDFAIKLGDSGLYLNTEGLLAIPPRLSQPKQIRIKTGLLMDFMNERERHQTIIGLIRSAEMTPKKKQSRTASYKKKYPNLLTSNATIIVCLRSKLKKWISSIENDFKDCKLVKIGNEAENEIYSCEDVIDADIILTTYEHLSKYPIIKYVPDRECLSKKTLIPFYYFHFRRVIYDNLTRKSKYFFKKYHGKALKIESDYIWGIVNTKFELTKAFFNPVAIEYLGLPKLMKHNMIFKQYLTGKFVKIHESSSTSTLNLPEYTEESVMIQMNTQEIMYTRGEYYLNSTKIRQLEECFNIENDYSCDTIEFKDFYTEKIRNSYVNMKTLEMEMEIERQLYNVNLDDLDQISEDDFVEKFSSRFKIYKEAKSGYNFKNNCLNDLKNNYTEQKCPICFDRIPEFDLGISDCCHIFCHKCGDEYFKVNCKCPVCHENSSLHLITNDPVNEELLKKYDLRIYCGSRLRKVACYIKNVLAEECDPRMILYVKNREQKELVEELMLKLSLTISNRAEFDKVDIKPKPKFLIQTKRNFQSPRKFKSVNHLLILQPFLGVSSASEAEDDGITSVINSKSPLKVVRFVLKDTIEEKLFIKKQKYRGK